MMKTPEEWATFLADVEASAKRGAEAFRRAAEAFVPLSERIRRSYLAERPYGGDGRYWHHYQMRGAR